VRLKELVELGNLSIAGSLIIEGVWKPVFSS
jgi:hypothetical protein